MSAELLAQYGVPQTYNLTSAIVGTLLAGAAIGALVGYPLLRLAVWAEGRKLRNRINRASVK